MPLGPVFVTLLIPCNDEADALPALFAELVRLPAILAPHFPEIVFVDDGSTDATQHLLIEFADRAAFPCKVLGLSPNGGIGHAIREGARLCAGEAVVTYDADRAYPLEDGRALVAALEAGADVATATPFAPAGAVDDVPWAREFLSRACSFAYRARLSGAARGVRTFTCGFRAYRSDFFHASLPSRTGFPATAELLLNALKRGARVVECASRLRVREHGASKLRVGRTILGHLGLLVAGPRVWSPPPGRDVRATSPRGA